MVHPLAFDWYRSYHQRTSGGNELKSITCLLLKRNAIPANNANTTTTAIAIPAFAPVLKLVSGLSKKKFSFKKIPKIHTALHGSFLTSKAYFAVTLVASRGVVTKVALRTNFRVPGAFVDIFHINKFAKKLKKIHKWKFKDWILPRHPGNVALPMSVRVPSNPEKQVHVRSLGFSKIYLGHKRINQIWSTFSTIWISITPKDTFRKVRTAVKSLVES